MEINDKEENKISSIQANTIEEKKEIIIEEDPTNILKEIFIHKQSEEKVIYSPILNNSKNLGEKLISIFNKPSSEIITDINSYKKYITNRINIINNIIEIIHNSYDIMHIIMNFLCKNNIYVIKDIIDIYVEIITSIIFDKNEEKNKAINDIKNILNYFLSGGLFNQININYIFQSLSKIQLEKKLTPKLFNDYLSLIEIIYGKEINKIKMKKNLIAKNYIYLYDKENSLIKTNVSKINNIYLKEGCTIFIWFYLKQEKIIDEMKICNIGIIKAQESNHNNIEFVLNNNDIDVKINSSLLKEIDGKKFEIKNNNWIQLKIQMVKNMVKISIFQDLEMKEENSDDKNNQINKINKYENKIYYLNNKNIMNNNDFSLDFNDIKIIDLNFFKNFVGYAGSIILCKNENPSEVPIKSQYGLKSTKISKFIEESSLSNIFFILSPSLYIKEKNKFIYMNNNITGEIQNNSLESLEEDDINNIIDFNNVFKFSNIVNNIYEIGGCANILPLFEIFYKFTKNTNETENEHKILENIFYKLFQLIELIIVNKPKNYLDIYYNNNDFFTSIQLFLENINEKFYKNEEIINILLNIGKYVYNYCKDYENIIIYDKIKNPFIYFKSILFCPKLVLKFSLEQQNKIWNFFEDVKIIPKKESKTYNFTGINLSFCKKCFISFFQLNTFILLFNKKYKNEFLSPDLINIIKYLFLLSDTNDLERESLLLLINENIDIHKNRLSDKIIISIIQIFNFYFESAKYLIKKPDSIKPDKKDVKDISFHSPKTSLESFLNLDNYFIENLLRILSTNNLRLKKVIINLIKIISTQFIETLRNYFIKVETDIKKSRKTKKINKVTGKEFYYFIQENISPNLGNDGIRERQKYHEQFNQNNIEDDKERRKSSMDSLNLINKSMEEKNMQIENNNNDDNTNNQNKQPEQSKKKQYRSKTPEEKPLDEIKTQFFQRAKEKISLPRKTEYNFINNRISSPYETNSQTKMIRILSLKNPINEFIEKENEEEEKENEDKNAELNLIETQKIAMALFEWLINCENINNINANQKRLSGSLLLSPNTIFDKSINIDFNFSEIIINYLMKLFFSKNLEVINKILFLIIGQKGTEILDKNKIKIPNETYNRLLGYFSKSKSKFIQFLEELMVNSYLCLYYEEAGNKFNWIEDTVTYLGLEKGKDEYFKEIYNKSKEILIDIYFYENNMNNCIIDEVFDIVLDLFGGLKKINEITDENIQIKNILMTFIEKFLESIEDLFNSKLEYYKKIMKNTTSNEKLDLIKIKYKNIKKNYICFSNFVFEYLFLLINSNNFISKTFTKENTKVKNYIGLPDFLTYEVDKDKNKKIFDIKIDLYLKIYEKIIDEFNIEKDLEKVNNPPQEKRGSLDLNEKKEKIKKEKYKRNIFYLEPSDINKFLKEYTNNKEYKSYIKEKLNLLFLSYNSEFKDVPFIIIITIVNNYYISKKVEEKLDLQSEEGFNFISFLNSHMKFILTIILISFLIKENEHYNTNKNYKEMQEIIFYILLYNINNIVNNINSNFGENFVELLANIMTSLSCLWVEDKEHKSLFSIGKSKQKNAIKKTLNYYSTKNKKFFDAPIFEKISSQNVTKTREMITPEKAILYESIIKTLTEDKPENLPLINIFNISNYEYIYNSRKYNLNHKLKLLINDVLDNKLDSMIESDEDKEYYENILYKVDKLKVVYDNNELYKYCSDTIKRKNYRKIKKTLYSWNNAYSNLNVFYNNKNNNINNNKEKSIKYKLSNYLSGDMTRKILVPILDIDYYIPKFQLFNYKEKLFDINEKTQINEYENIYKIDLNIFEEKNNIPKEINKFNIFNVCYIKSTHHIRGKIFFEKELTKNSNKSLISLTEPISSIFFIESNITNKNLLLKEFEDYDSESDTCFISIFKNNNNPKDPETFLKFDFSDIIFIFIRKYCLRNNSLEIYLSNHRSYYFKFFDTKSRDDFLSELILLLNKNNPKNKLFKSIKGLDENNKSIIIGYFKDEENNKDFSSISIIRDLWKNNKISTLEYLMWINIYGNRSFRDSSQYPVFPWLLTNHEYKNSKELIKNMELRNFNYPMGLLCIDEKSKKRQDAYIETYKIMVMNLTEENLLNIKIKEEDDIIEPIPMSLNNNNNSNTKNFISSSYNPSYSSINLNEMNNNLNISPTTSEQIIDKYIPKIPDYKFDIEKLYSNLNFEYEKIPYFFGSHFSNSMYVSHYLMRVFPYCLNMIEIQKTGFDVPERLFINLQKSIYTSLSDKGDLREIIPEFFTLPEMFLNINELNLGKLKNDIYIGNPSENNENEEMIKINEVIMPSWCEKSPFIFSEKYRKILESQNLNINPWIDLIFGYTQRGIKAQKVGNVFLPYAYDGVMNLRLTKEMILNNRVENEFKMRFCEMGIHPTKVFEKKNKIMKNKLNNQLIDIIETKQVIIPEIRLKKNNENNYIIGNKKKIIFFHSYLDDNDEFFILDNNFLLQKINIQESKESEKIFYIKESSLYKEFPIKEKVNKNIQSKLIIKTIFQNKYFIIGGYFNGDLYIIKTPNKLTKKEESIKGLDKPYNLSQEKIIKKFDKSLITALEIDKNEKYLIYGTLNGSIVIYYLNHILFKENKNFIEFKKIFKSHNNASISSIYINSDLNIFADCSIDGYINIYTLSSYNNFRIINSIYISNNFIPNFIFLSAQPLPCVVLYSNELCKFKCYSINGNELTTTESDNNLMSNKFNEYYVENEQNMISPLIYTDAQFNDYLIYIFKKKYVLIREFPSMKIRIPFNPTLDNHNEELCSLSISEDKKYLYVLEQNCNKIYMINQKMFGNGNK